MIADHVVQGADEADAVELPRLQAAHNATAMRSSSSAGASAPSFIWIERPLGFDGDDQLQVVGAADVMPDVDAIPGVRSPGRRTSA